MLQFYHFFRCWWSFSRFSFVQLRRLVDHIRFWVCLTFEVWLFYRVFVYYLRISYICVFLKLFFYIKWVSKWYIFLVLDQLLIFQRIHVLYFENWILLKFNLFRMVQWTLIASPWLFLQKIFKIRTHFFQCAFQGLIEVSNQLIQK